MLALAVFACIKRYAGDELVPLNKNTRLHELMAVCREYFKDDNRRSITMEYV